MYTRCNPQTNKLHRFNLKMVTQ